MALATQPLDHTLDTQANKVTDVVLNIHKRMASKRQFQRPVYSIIILGMSVLLVLAIHLSASAKMITLGQNLNDTRNVGNRRRRFIPAHTSHPTAENDEELKLSLEVSNMPIHDEMSDLEPKLSSEVTDSDDAVSEEHFDNSIDDQKQVTHDDKKSIVHIDEGYITGEPEGALFNKCHSKDLSPEIPDARISFAVEGGTKTHNLHLVESPSLEHDAVEQTTETSHVPPPTPTLDQAPEQTPEPAPETPALASEPEEPSDLASASNPSGLAKWPSMSTMSSLDTGILSMTFMSEGPPDLPPVRVYLPEALPDWNPEPFSLNLTEYPELYDRAQSANPANDNVVYFDFDDLENDIYQSPSAQARRQVLNCVDQFSWVTHYVAGSNMIWIVISPDKDPEEAQREIEDLGVHPSQFTIRVFNNEI